MNEDITTPSELDTLKERATQLGISFHPSIGVDKLREKVAAALDGDNDEGGPGDGTQEDRKIDEQAESTAEFRLRKKREASELVRIQVTCMNPNKRDYDGELFMAGNGVVGTFKKYVPFDVEWHVPRVIMNMIKQRRCQIFVSKKDDKGRTIKVGKSIPEFNVVELEPLSKEELADLRQRQAMANGTASAA